LKITLPLYYTDREKADLMGLIKGDELTNEVVDEFYNDTAITTLLTADGRALDAHTYRSFREDVFCATYGFPPSEEELNNAIIETAASWAMVRGLIEYDRTEEGIAWKKKWAFSGMYQPIPLVDTKNMPNDIWLDWRKVGIGGSDAAALFGKSKWKSNVDIYNVKIGKPPVIKESEDNWFILAYGHANEELVAECFKRSTGFPVINDTVMYRHPIFPWMQANLDRKTLTPNGSAILEIKTTTYFNKEAWANDTVPEDYLYQGKHYLGIMNYPTIFYACLYGNVEDDCVRRRRERDIATEESLIDVEMSFWLDNVIPKKEPVLIGCADVKANTLRVFSGYADKQLGDVKLEGSALNVLDNIRCLTEQRDAAKKIYEDAEEALKNARLPIIAALGQYCSCVIENGDEVTKITYNPQQKKSTDYDKLALAFPEAYAACVSLGEEYRVLRMNKAKKKPAKYVSPAIAINVI